MDILKLICFCCCLVASVENVEAVSRSFSKYDIVDFEVLKPRTKRSATSRGPYPSDLEVAFKSFNRDFHLLLRRDTSFEHIPVEAGNPKTTARAADLKVRFYEGFLGDQPTKSVVLGFMSGGTLTALIGSGNETYYVEPARSFLENPSMDDRKIAVYKASDVRRERWNTEDYILDFDELLTDQYSASEVTEKVSGVDVDKSMGELFCEIEMVADHTLYNLLKKSVDKVAATLYLHAKFADRVFRNTDFRMKGKPGVLRITVGKISIYKSKEDKNYPMSGVEIPEAATNISSYFRAFSLRQQESRFCLSTGMFCRPFPGQARGLTLVPDGSVKGFGYGGICDRPIAYNGTGFNRTGINYKKRYLNIGVMNLCGQDGKILPLDASLRSFAREMAHAFGSQHDPKTGNSTFLMHPVHNASAKSLTDLPNLSPGSRKNITNAVRMYGGCLKNKKAVCGNGIKEVGEACDCGPKATCAEVDPCCTPSCTLKATCSPKEQACCKDCSSVQPVGKMCYRDDHLCSVSFCDGSSPACPEPKKFPPIFCKPEGLDICYPDDVYCKAACLTAEGFEDCFCTDTFAAECLRCCRRRGGGQCLPALHFGLNTTSGRPFLRMQADPCSIGFCDSAGNCVGDPNRSALPIWLTAIFPAPGVLLGVCALIGIGLFVWKHRKKLREEPTSAAEPIVEPDSEDPAAAPEDTPEDDLPSRGRFVAGGRAPKKSIDIDF